MCHHSQKIYFTHVQKYFLICLVESSLSLWSSAAVIFVLFAAILSLVFCLSCVFCSRSIFSNFSFLSVCTIGTNGHLLMHRSRHQTRSHQNHLHFRFLLHRFHRRPHIGCFGRRDSFQLEPEWRQELRRRPPLYQSRCLQRH